jgi:O-antigen/teichoic acid export membrane protein
MTRLLVPPYHTRFVVAPISQTLNVFGRQNLHLMSSGLDATTLATSFIVAWHFDLTPLTTILMFSLGSSVAFLLYYRFAYEAARGSSAGDAREVARKSQDSLLD